MKNQVLMKLKKLFNENKSKFKNFKSQPPLSTINLRVIDNYLDV